MAARQEVVLDEHRRGAGGADVFLGASVDEPVAAWVERAREEVAGRVADEGRLARRPGGELGAVDGVVAREVEVGGAVGVLARRFAGDVGVVLVCAAGGHVNGRAPRRADDPGLSDGLRAPRAGVDVVAHATVRQKVERDLVELHRSAALEEEHVPVIAQA